MSFDFSATGRMERKNCEECGQTFEGFPQERTCLECRYLRDNPEQAPKYWTWRRRGSGIWGVSAHWPDNEPLPEPGDQVTVHRKNGSTSVETIREVDGLIYLPTGQARLDCFVD